MKKLCIIMVALALLAGLPQCKKGNTPTPTNDGEKVNITLNVGGGASTGSATGNGSRADVNTENGEVTFEENDVIHVASGGVYVGTLTYDGTNFSGEVTEPTEGQKLQFYFLGNKTPEFNDDNTGCSVVISDQRTKLPVISYAPSRENYETGRTAYNATLLNKCALVKFDVTSVVPNLATCLKGMNNKVTVNFADNSFAYSQDDEGIITLPAGEGEKWGILLPQNVVVDTEANSSDGIWTGSCGCIPAIAENDYLTEGITVEITHPTGSVNSLFTINAYGAQVRFSKGNMQYIGSAGNGDDNNTGAYWKFADHQWDYLGTTTGQNSDSKTVDRDLFGWGTGCLYLMPPWSTGTVDADYFAYGNRFYSLYDSDGSADWGYNAISNGGNTINSGWRTLKDYEWSYVFNTRSTTSGIRWAFGIVNGINGVILLPDDWIPSIYTLNDPNGGDYPSNTITAEDWVNVLEANGAVFLPAADSRVGTMVQGVGLGGNYWSAKRHESELFFAKCLIFIAGNLEAEYAFFFHRGLSVRVVLDVE